MVLGCRPLVFWLRLAGAAFGRVGHDSCRAAAEFGISAGGEWTGRSHRPDPRRIRRSPQSRNGWGNFAGLLVARLAPEVRRLDVDVGTVDRSDEPGRGPLAAGFNRSDDCDRVAWPGRMFSRRPAARFSNPPANFIVAAHFSPQRPPRGAGCAVDVFDRASAAILLLARRAALPGPSSGWWSPPR